MKSHYRAVVIGGGVVGAWVLYHLARFGWRDVALIERAELTAGSTWHAAGGFHAINADPNVAALQDYTIKLYRELEAECGQNVGLHMTGGVNMASDPQRWEWLKSAWAVFQTIGMETARLVTPEEIKESARSSTSTAFSAASTIPTKGISIPTARRTPMPGPRKSAAPM